MAVVHIPAYWREQTGGRATVEVQGRNLREVIDALDAACPGMKRVLTDDRGEVRSEIAVGINSEITESSLLEPVPPDAEIHFVPAISGG